MNRLLVLGIAALASASGALAQAKKIIVTGLPPASVDELKAAVPQANLVAVGPPDRIRNPSEVQGEIRKRLMAEIVDADAILGTINPDLVRAGKKLRWFQSYSAGVETYLHLSAPDLRDSPIVVTNAKIIQGPNIADHASSMLLAHARDLPRIIRTMPKEQWTRGQHNHVI